MTPLTSAATSGWNSFDAHKPLASWYTEGARDGIGDRLLMFDNSETPSLELLRFRPALANAASFEDALRERVDRLRPFTHQAFSQVRAVERLDGGELVLASTFTTGKRLSEIFWTRQARTGVHPAFAAWLVRELTSAVADLQRQGRLTAHGCLAPERVVLAPDGHLVIVEHVLGSALDRLRLPFAAAWDELGLFALDDGQGRARLDQRTDVVQLGWIALSLLLGRRVTALEYPHRVDALLDEFVTGSRGRSPALVIAARRWLERALHSNGNSFESAVEAQAGLGDLRIHGGPHAIAFASSSGAVERLAFETPRQLPAFDSAAEEAPTEKPASEARPMETTSDLFASFGARPDVATAAAPIVARPRRLPAIGWVVAAALAAVAAGEAIWIGRLQVPHPAALPAASAPITVDSLQHGDAVVVDGRDAGITPLTLTLTPGMRSISVRARTDVAEPAPVQTAAVVDRPVDSAFAAALAQAAAKERRGGLRVSSPIELQVLEGERVLGTSTDGPVVVSAGRHELDFVNSALGYKSHQIVEIRAGQIVPMTVLPPDGRVSVNAVPWAQVSMDGNLVGETPLANLPLAVGEHEITFRHPQLGEQTQKVIVKANVVTRVSATFAR